MEGAVAIGPRTWTCIYPAPAERQSVVLSVPEAQMNPREIARNPSNRRMNTQSPAIVRWPDQRAHDCLAGLGGGFQRDWRF